MQSIQEVMEQLQQQRPHRHRHTAAVLACAWQQTMPLAVQQRTLRTFYKEGTFFVQLSSAPLRHALQANKDQLKAQLQAHLPPQEPLEIVFL